MAIQLETLSRAFLLEDIVIKNLKKLNHTVALTRLFHETAAFSGIATLASLVYEDRNITLLFGLTTALACLANSYFCEKYRFEARVINILNNEVEELKKQAKTS
jgi:hypothetical protein